MPGGGQPKRTVRIDKDTWDAFVAEAKRADKKPTTLLAEFIRFYARIPGAKRPDRPAHPEQESPDSP